MQFFRYVWLACPSKIEALMIAILWGVTMPICFLADYVLWRHMLPPETSRIAVMVSIGAAVAGPIAWWCTKIITRKHANSAFATMFVLLSMGTLGLTTLIFAFEFWLYFSQWHGAIFSRLWTIQLGFTFASAIYQFLVSGLRLYLPFGLIALVIASMWASHRICR